MEKYTCPCCGYKTLSEEPRSYEICSVCFWQDDFYQLENPNDEGGPNRVSLRTAQQNFVDFGACEFDMKRYSRLPNKNEPKDPHWKLLE